MTKMWEGRIEIQAQIFLFFARSSLEVGSSFMPTLLLSRAVSRPAAQEKWNEGMKGSKMVSGGKWRLHDDKRGQGEGRYKNMECGTQRRVKGVKITNNYIAKDKTYYFSSASVWHIKVQSWNFFSQLTFVWYSDPTDPFQFFTRKKWWSLASQWALFIWSWAGS